MRRSMVPAVAVAIGVLVGWIFGAGVASWSDDGTGGPLSAELAVAAIAGGIATVLAWLVLDRLAARRLLDAPRRKAGGVGEESATAQPDDTG